MIITTNSGSIYYIDICIAATILILFFITVLIALYIVFYSIKRKYDSQCKFIELNNQKTTYLKLEKKYQKLLEESGIKTSAKKSLAKNLIRIIELLKK